MKRKTARPRGTPLSLFFFSHLSNEARSPAAGNREDAALAALPSAPSSSLQQPPLPSGTGIKDVDGVLWDQFTPAAYRDKASTFLAEERIASLALEGELAAAWSKVEDLMERNKARRSLLDSASLSNEVAPMSDLLFWTTEEVAQRFGLEGSVGSECGEEDESATSVKGAVKSSSMIKLDFSVLAARPLSDAQSATSQEEDDGETDSTEKKDPSDLGTHHTRAYGAADRDLLDPCKRPHCLRRLFAPTLRRKDALPRNTALLLQEVQEIQSQELPRIEAILQEISILFSVPVYVPFRAIAEVLARDVCKPSNISSLEDDVVGLLKLGELLVGKLDAYVSEHTRDPQQLEQLSHDEKLALAERMWRLLFAELDDRKTHHASGLQGFHAVTQVAEDSYNNLISSLDRCAVESGETMAQLMQDAEGCADAVVRSQERTTRLTTDMDKAYTENKAQLQAAVDAKSHLLVKSEASQERLARRVREAIKELYAEQVAYEEASAELLRDRLSLAQLETSYGQLRKSFEVRHEQAQQVVRYAADLKEMLHLAESSRQRLLSACRQHAERVHHDDYYRRCRVMSKVADNAQGWSRCVSDIGALYERRFADLEGKSKASWQLNYLVAGERDWAAGNLLDVRPEIAELRASWAALQPLLEPLDLAEADQKLQLDSRGRGGGDDAVDERRLKMALLDSPHAVQRKVLTLAQYKEEKRKRQKPQVSKEYSKTLVDQEKLRHASAEKTGAMSSCATGMADSESAAVTHRGVTPAVSAAQPLLSHSVESM